MGWLGGQGAALAGSSQDEGGGHGPRRTQSREGRPGGLGLGGGAAASSARRAGGLGACRGLSREGRQVGAPEVLATVFCCVWGGDRHSALSLAGCLARRP